MIHYVVMRLQSWDNLEVKSNPVLSNLIKFEGMGTGFLPVFSSREDALAEFPADSILEIQEV